MIKRSHPVVQAIDQIFESAAPAQRADDRCLAEQEDFEGSLGAGAGHWRTAEAIRPMVTATIRARVNQRRLERELQQSRDLLIESQARAREAQDASDSHQLTEEYARQGQLRAQVQRLSAQQVAAMTLVNSLKRKLLSRELAQAHSFDR